MQSSIFYDIASVYNAINWLSPLQFATITMINVGLAFFGGRDCQKKMITLNATNLKEVTVKFMNGSIRLISKLSL